jgi:tetratricopeptide (TPR) repeat protein
MLWVKVLNLIALAAGVSSAAYAQPIELQTFKTHSRLKVLLDESVVPKVVTSKNGFEVTFPSISPLDLGVGVGSQEDTTRNLKDHRITRLWVDDLGLAGVKLRGEWRFPEGERALAKPEMHVFDYRQKSPGKWVMDFWLKPGPTLAEARANQARLAKAAEVRKLESRVNQRNRRFLASVEKRKEADTADFFCDAPLTSERDVVIPFRPVGGKIEFSKWFSAVKADENYPYLEPKGEDRESEHVKLAISLYRDSKPALSIRTIEFFEKEFQNSIYRVEMQFLRANALIMLGQGRQAREILKSLLLTNPKHPASLHAGMYLAMQTYESGEFLNSLEAFTSLWRHFGDHRLTWVFHLGAAESLAALKQTERAIESYAQVIKLASSPNDQAIAAFRIGSLYLDRQQYAQALAAYYKALKDYPQQGERDPELVLNRAEALFWLGQNDRASAEMSQFLKRFPSHPEGWRATLRLAEISLRKTAPRTNLEYEALLKKTVNQYPSSPGVVLARLRLMPCGTHGGFSASSATRYLSEDASQFDASDAVAMDRYSELLALTRFRAMVSLKQGDSALRFGRELLERYPLSAARGEVLTSMQRVLRKRVLALLKDGKKLAALKTYEEAEKWNVLGGSPTESDYLLGLSDSAIELGLNQLGQKILGRYQAIAQQAQARTPASAEEGVDLEEVARRSELNFIQAKNLWLTQGLTAREEIQSRLQKIAEESPRAFEREVLLSVILEAAGDTKKALGHALRALALSRSGPPEGVVAVETWIAKLQLKLGEYAVAERSFRKLREALGESKESVPTASSPMRELGLADASDREALLMGELQAIEKQERWADAASLYAVVIERGAKDNRTLYSYARALEQNGSEQDIKKSNEILTEIQKSGAEDFWKKLAQEALKARRNP